MSNAVAPGPEVDVKEDLYRCITTNDWWVIEENRPSSATFRQPDFSADVASIAGSPEYTLSRFPPGCGLVMFNCGAAKNIGFVVRLEADPNQIENRAHANVYNTQPTDKKRKILAKKLIEKIVESGGIVRVPNFS